MAYELIPWRPDLREDVAVLQSKDWRGPWQTAEYLSWKFEHNPYIHDPLIYLAASDGKVVGMRGAYGTCWEVGEERTSFCLPCLASTFIEPDHRDRGLFAELTAFALRDLAERGYPYAVNMSAGPVTALGQIVGGWRGVGRQTVLLRRRRGRIVQRKAAAALGRRNDVFSRFDRVHRENEPFAGSSAAGRGLRHVRDEKYFAWRLRNPRAVYRVAAGRDGRLVLAATLQGRRVEIVDWDAVDAPALHALVHDALRDGRFETMRLRLTRSDESVLEVFQALGFDAVAPESREDLTPALFVRPTSDVLGPWTLGGVDLRDPNAWELRTLDTDLV